MSTITVDDRRSLRRRRGAAPTRTTPASSPASPPAGTASPRSPWRSPPRWAPSCRSRWCSWCSRSSPWPVLRASGAAGSAPPAPTRLTEPNAVRPAGGTVRGCPRARHQPPRRPHRRRQHLRRATPSALLEELASTASPTVKRAYGDWTTQQLTGWKERAAPPRDPADPAVRLHDGQELHRLRADHRRDGPALLRQPRRLRDRLQRQRLHPAGDPAARVRQDRLRPRPATHARRRSWPPCDRFIYLEVLGAASRRARPSDAGDDEPPPPLPDLRRILIGAIELARPTTTAGRRSSRGRQPHQPAPTRRSTRATTASPSSVELARAQDYVEVEQVRRPAGAGPAPPPAARRRAAAKKTARKSAGPTKRRPPRSPRSRPAG